MNAEEISAKSYFDLFFTDNVWEIIVRETNKYHDYMVQNEPAKHKMAWTPVTRDEMEAFVGILVLMGIVKLPRFRMYWMEDSLLHQEGVTSVMPHDRLLQIWRYFHLADNSVAPARDTPGFDKLYRVREFLNIVSHNISTEYKLSRDISIDETMVPHKGRLSFKQYIKNKPTQWGIKLWVLSEARTGYVYRFQVYLGKENNNPERNLARRVVRDLTTTVEGNNHHLYMDNFYCDPHLFLERKDSGIYCCGTVRTGRKRFPKDIVISKADEKRLQRGHYEWRAHGQLIPMSWFDRRGVYLLSTIHPPKNADDSLPTVPRSNGRGERMDVPCPPAQVDYQLYMGGVDLSDQLMKTFSVIRKSRKAWKKLFGYGLEICLLDSFIIMKKANSQSTKEFITYRLEVARQLIGQRSFRQKTGRPPSLTLSETDEKRLNDKRHSLEVSDSRTDYVVCAKRASVQRLGKNYRYKSAIVCVTCNRTPLCITKDRNCWEKWHTTRVYWE